MKTGMAFNPININLLGANTVMFHPQLAMCLFE